jgi:murein DD-endopeptidase MepM/ murein hydrolase activator NlpD
MFQPYDRSLITDTHEDHIARTPPSLGGDDFAYGPGSPVIAPADGVVDLVDDDMGGSGGRMVGVNHGAGVRSEQLHLSRIIVTKGQTVREGQTIGYSGGSAYGQEHGVGYHIHCHFVVNGVRLGWLNYLALIGATAGGVRRPVLNGGDNEMAEFMIRVQERSGKLGRTFKLDPIRVVHIVDDKTVEVNNYIGVPGGGTVNQVSLEDARRLVESRGFDWAKVSALKAGEAVRFDGTVVAAGIAPWPAVWS